MFRISTPEAEAPSCPAGFRPEFSTHEVVLPEPSTCGCACGAVEDGVCEGEQVFERRSLSENPDECEAEVMELIHVPVGTVVDVDFDWVTPLVSKVSLIGGACTPIVTADHPPVQAFAHLNCAAELDADAPCEAGHVCFPEAMAGPNAAVCIARAGDHACPAEYPLRERHDQSAIDTRDCACSCGDPEGKCAVRNLMLEFLPEVAVFFEVGECRGMSRLIEVTGEPHGKCEPSAPEIVGGIEAGDPITYCCLPPA